MRLELTVQQQSGMNGAAEKRLFCTFKNHCSIGRDIGDIVVSNDAQMSRIHALFYEWQGALFVRDLKSTNGVRVNDQVVVEGPVRPGALITVGATTLKIENFEPNG